MQRKGSWLGEWRGSGRPYPAFRISTPGSVTRPHDGFPLFLVRRDHRECINDRIAGGPAHDLNCLEFIIIVVIVVICFVLFVLIVFV